MSILCLAGHKWTSSPEEGVSPTDEQLQNGIDGFYDYAAIYCKRCGKNHPLNTSKTSHHKPVDKMEPEDITKSLKNEFYKMSFFFENAASVSYFRIACQGNHAITGGCCVVDVKHNAGCSMSEIKSILGDFFYGRENYSIENFTERVKKKLSSGSYANYISIHGEDFDGDKLDVELKFHSQAQMLFVAENGLFKLEGNRNGSLTMLGR